MGRIKSVGSLKSGVRSLLLERHIKRIGIGSIVFGFFLMVAIGVYPIGFYSPYLLPDSSGLKGYWGRSEELEDYSVLYRKQDELKTDYFKRLSLQVASHMIHAWPEGATGVHILDNYILWFQSKHSEYTHFANYEFHSPFKALNRGFGFCSQSAKVVYSVLRKQGFKPVILEHKEHTVVGVEEGVLDADYGVYIDASPEILMSDTSFLDRAYSDYPSMLPLLKRIYTFGWEKRTDHQLFDFMESYENIVEILKWFPPLMFILFGALCRRVTSG